MKTIPPPCPEPETGPKYWRSLDQLADTAEFRQWAEKEFPAGASELTDPVSRRNFVKLMSASFLLAGLGATGCRRPEERILPFSRMPENYVHGVSQYFATARPTRTGAVPLVVRSHEGRPVKIEGNSQIPDGNGGTDRFTQASILNLYDPDRTKNFTKGGPTNFIQREVVQDYLGEVSRRFTANQGEGLSFLLDHGTSPSRLRLQKAIQQKMPKAAWYSYEPVDYDIHRRAASAAFGQSVAPLYNFDKASVILSLDCDFIGNEDDTVRHIKNFTNGRKVRKPGDAMNRLYVVESLLTLTGGSADHRLRVAPGAIAQVASQFASAILDKAAVQDKWIAECAKDLVGAQGKALVVAGYRQPLEVHLLAHAINAALGAVGTTLALRPVPEFKQGSIQDLAKSLNAGQVSTLIVIGGNPVYNAPAELDWASAQKKAGETIRLGYSEDETFAISTWTIAAAHYLESWGDGLTTDGVYVPIQPLIEPLFGGLTELEVLARLAGVEKPGPHEVVRETFRSMAGDNDFENNWRKFLHDGYLQASAPKAVAAQLNAAAVADARKSVAAGPKATKDSLDVVFFNDHSVDDGRYNNNGWLQEMPDPVTKIVWDNAVLMSPKTASEFGLGGNAEPKDGKFHNSVVTLQVKGKTVKGGVWVVPGMADNTVGLALGYGRNEVGRVGKGTGFNAYAVRTSDTMSYASGAKLSVVAGEQWHVVTTQEHWAMEGRPIVREANLEQFKKKPDFAKNMDLEAHAPNAGPIYQHPYVAQPGLKSDVHQWGMSIDLSACVGCGSCMMACQSENNIPIVGKDQVSRGREMHWLRIDRYFSSSKTDPKAAAEDPQMTNQPMLCQHCESAPCESVCPVNATVHDEEGLNVMAYNRCVGTRYCSNNCPYKVRRFNFFDYNRRPLARLYDSPLTSMTDGKYELARWFNKPEEGSKPADEWELLKLVKNPDVTVRMRGVMEKCTFCVQRIEGAKITQKVKVGASGDVMVPEGTFTTACAQACPAGAIVFGNMLDPKSKVNELKKLELNYSVLGFLDTKPRLTYLARLRNPNPAMPDAHAGPLSLEEYTTKNGDPMAEHGAGEGHGEAHATTHAPESAKGGAH